MSFVGSYFYPYLFLAIRNIAIIILLQCRLKSIGILIKLAVSEIRSLKSGFLTLDFDVANEGIVKVFFHKIFACVLKLYCSCGIVHNYSYHYMRKCKQWRI